MGEKSILCSTINVLIRLATAKLIDALDLALFSLCK